MTRYAILALLAAAACTSREPAPDTTTLPAVDTLKPVAVSDTLPTRADVKVAAPASAPAKAGTTKAPSTKTKAPRDSAFPPPKNLPQLDTVKRKPPAR